MYCILEGNNVTLIGKKAQGQTWTNALIDISDCKGALKWAYVKNEPCIWSQNLKNSQNHQFIHYY